MLRWYQEEAVQSIFDYFDRGGRGNPCLAMPTASGKSHVIAEFIKIVLARWPSQRFLVLTHRKELIVQDHDKLMKAWPFAPAGIFSAGLGLKQAHYPITFGGVKSVSNALDMFDWIDLIFIDECHLVSDEEDSHYLKIIYALKKRNPKLKVIGLSATIFRLGMGMLTEGKIFTDVIYDITGVGPINRLIGEGFLSQLIPRPTRTKIDVAGISQTKGDYNQKQVQAAVDKDSITRAAVEEALGLLGDRRAWLAFATGIEHAEHVSAMLNSFGINSSFVHSKITTEERDNRISLFKRRKYKCLVNANILTTGFDDPEIDAILMLRPTMSPVLWVQMLGRGMRVAYGKINCIVLDYAGNTRRLGPINDPLIPNPKNKTSGVAPVKTCDKCGVLNHISVRYCIYCMAEFGFAVKIEERASSEQIMKTELPQVDTYDVRSMILNWHMKKDRATGQYVGLPTIEVAYYVDGFKKPFREYIGFDAGHKAFTLRRSHDWWKKRHWSKPPASAEEALAHSKELRTPKQIRVHVNRDYPEIIGYEW